MKYRVGNRFRYFSIVGKIKHNTGYILECICDCGIFFTHPVKHIGRKINLTCNSNKKCALWVEMNKQEVDWPDYSRKRYYDFMHALRGNSRIEKTCKTCNKKKLKSLFHPDMQQTCFECLGDQTPEQFRDNEDKRRYNKRRDKISPVKEVIGSALDKDGYIYIMYSPSMNLYKIGVAKNPFIRVRTIAYMEYKIKDLVILCIGNPIGRSFDCEGYIHKMIRQYKIEYKKPCGGMSNELFSCTLITAANIFLSVCQEAYWLDDNTRDLIDFNIPKIGLDEVNKIRREKSTCSSVLKRLEVAIANKMLRDMHKRLSFNLVNLKGIKCYASGDRKDGKFESIARVNKTLTSLGVFDTWAEAYEHQREFVEFVIYERLKRHTRRIFGEIKGSYLYRYHNDNEFRAECIEGSKRRYREKKAAENSRILK